MSRPGRRRLPVALLIGSVLGAALPLLAAPQRAPIGIASFEQLFDEYRRGDSVVAAEAFGKWPDKRVRAEATLPPGPHDTATLVAFVMFHTEAGIAKLQFGSLTGNLRSAAGLGYWGLEKIFEAHSYYAYRVIEDLAELADETQDRRLHDFTRSWYIVAMSFCHRWGRYPCTQSLLEKGETHFNNDAEFRLVKGSVKQNTRMTRVKADSIPYQFLQAMAQLPRWEFKQALKRDPKLAEARIRLAHTTHVFLNYPEAKEELERALEDAREAHDEYSIYLAAVFLGELHEDADRLAEAATYYEIAVLARRAHTASVALGQALIRLGRRDEGLDIGRRMFGSEGPGISPIPDPYVMYHYAQAWQIPGRLAWMREMGRIK